MSLCTINVTSRYFYFIFAEIFYKLLFSNISLRIAYQSKSNMMIVGEPYYSRICQTSNPSIRFLNTSSAFHLIILEYILWTMDYIL